jgi:hypothetical protein
LKYKHLKLVSLLIDFLTVDSHCLDINNYLIANGIKYPEKALHELTLAVQERLAFHE